MKKGVTILAALLILSLIPVAYSDPDDNPGKALGLLKNGKQNDEGATKLDWNPSGSEDVIGDDANLKLIINCPEGKVVATTTGILRGLEPSTEYTVRIADGQITSAWNMTGTWTRNVVYSGSIHTHSYNTIQSGDSYTGTGRTPATGTIESTESVSGTVTGDYITFRTVYLTGDVGYIQDAVGAIAPDGSISGTWTDNEGRSGTWTSPAGNAKPSNDATNTNYLTTPTVTFETNPAGNAHFHMNLEGEDFASNGQHDISLQIREGETPILNSDPITITIHGHGHNK